MTEPNDFNDAPINSPENDRFGIDPFAQAIAESIQEISSPLGVTIALNGSWGSGKSSTVNLIRHHLLPAVESGNLAIINFKCWWFSGEEALTLAFLQELYAELEKSIGVKAQESVEKLAKLLLRASPILGPAMNLATGGVWGALAGSSIDVGKEFFSKGNSVESIFDSLSKALEDQKKRYLIVIDDIDRLTPDEALLVFRLVKSVGQLPNVIYLLAFDRELAEKAVQEKYPSEGPHFLEKIVQASFEIPLPARDDLNNSILMEIEKHCGIPQGQDQVRRFMNIFYDVVVPYINSPRDVTRLTNIMAISWPPIADEVNIADYVALETMRLFEPGLYNSIRMSKERVCGVRQDYGGRDIQEQELQSFIDQASEKNHAHVRNGLMRLFPRLENVGRGSDFLEEWAVSRRVCSKKHFDTYFRMALGSEVLSIKEIEEIIESCGDSDFVRQQFRNAVLTIRRNGKSKVPLLLEELNAHSAEIAIEKFEPLLAAIFEVADEINREEDLERGMMSIGDAYLRIHWLIRKLTFERCDLDERSKILSKACENASFGWLVDFVSSAMSDYSPDSDADTPNPPEKCLVTADDLTILRGHAVKTIEIAGGNSELIAHPRLAYILYRWRDFSDDDCASVKAWTSEQLSDDTSVALFAKAFTSESWTHGMGIACLGDRVSMRHITAGVNGLDEIMDVKLFRERLEYVQMSETIEAPYKESVDIFLDAWSKKNKGKY